MIKILEYINRPYIVNNGYSFQLYRDGHPVSIEYLTYDEAKEALNAGDYTGEIADDRYFFGIDADITESLIRTYLGYTARYNPETDTYLVIEWKRDSIKTAKDKLKNFCSELNSRGIVSYNENKDCIELRVY